METERENTTGLIVLIDTLEMRRACLLSALEPWARDASLDLISSTPEHIHKYKDRCKDRIRLVIMNVGGASLNDHEQRGLLALVKASFRGPFAIVSDSPGPDNAATVASMGFQALLPAALPLDIAKQVLSFVMNGGTYFPREALLASSPAPIRNVDRSRATETAGTLTQRQHEVLDRLRFGKSNKHIARELNMQEATVKVHVRQIMRKLGAANRTQAALLAQMRMAPNPTVASDNAPGEISPGVLSSLSAQMNAAGLPVTR